MADVCQRVEKRGTVQMSFLGGLGDDVGAEKRNPHHDAFFDEGLATNMLVTRRAATLPHTTFVTSLNKVRVRGPLRVPSAEPRKC